VDGSSGQTLSGCSCWNGGRPEPLFPFDYKRRALGRAEDGRRGPARRHARAGGGPSLTGIPNIRQKGTQLGKLTTRASQRAARRRPCFYLLLIRSGPTWIQSDRIRPIPPSFRLQNYKMQTAPSQQTVTNLCTSISATRSAMCLIGLQFVQFQIDEATCLRLASIHAKRPDLLSRMFRTLPASCCWENGLCRKGAPPTP
jgi:hypothetical protein